MSGVSITGDGDRLRRAHRFPCLGRVIKSTYGTSPDISFGVEDDPAMSEEIFLSNS
jgi:hypothetical protein